MGSVSTKRTLERIKRKKLKTGVHSQQKTDITNSIQHNSQRNESDFDQELLAELISENIGNNNRIKRGGWPNITAKYNLKKQTDFNSNQIRNFYIKYMKNKNQSEKTINEYKKSEKISNEMSNIQNQFENQLEIKNDENSHANTLLTNNSIEKTINNLDNNERNSKLELEIPTKSINISEASEHIFNTLKSIFISLKIDDMDDWAYTPKISSLTIKKKLLQSIDDSVNLLIMQNGIQSIVDITKILYAAQLCYDKLSKENKPKTNWISNINNKINERNHDKTILNNYLNTPTLKLEDKKLFNKIIRRRKIKQSDKNTNPTHDEVRKIIFDLENEISLYQKRLDVHFRKKEYLRTNYLFECSRKYFYRKLESNDKNQNEIHDQQELSSYWKSHFCNTSDADETKMDVIIDKTLNPMQNTYQMNTSKELIENIINNLSSWKATGPDRIYNFYIKNIKSLRPYLISEIQKLCADPSLIPKYMFKTLTYMIPKKQNPKASEYRPISCLSNIYKIITKVFSINLTTILEMNNIISLNQIGARKNCLAAKEQLIFNHCISIYNEFKLKILWVDIRKAFDSVSFNYLLKITKRLNLPDSLQTLIKNMQENIEISLCMNKGRITSFKPMRGILQGDSLSPILFTLCMEPISRILNQEDKLKLRMNYDNTELRINHLFYMDDLKLFAENDDVLAELAAKLKNTLNAIGMEHNIEKSATNSDICKDYADVLSPIDGYKYLGLLEDVDSKFKSINLNQIFDRMKRRVYKLCSTKLTGKNLFTGINEYAISLINYYTGIIDIPLSTLTEQDKEIRNVLRDFKFHYKTASKERLYLKRNYNGRGLDNIEFKYEKMLLSLVAKIEEAATLSKRMNFIKHIYQNFIISLPELAENLRSKYEIKEETVITGEQLTNAFQIKLIKQIKRKGKHGKTFQDDSPALKTNDASIWLRRGKLDPKTEANMCNLQDRNVFYTIKKCPHCKTTNISVDHLATRCEKMLHFDYKKRHDEIVRVIVISILNTISQNPTKHIKYMQLKNVYDNKDYKICIDIPIRTDTIIKENKPDIVFFNYKKKEILFIEVGVTSKDTLKQTESWKKRKYELLAREYGRMTRMHVRVIPFVISWDGKVTEFNRHYRNQIGINYDIFGYIQSLCLRKTFESVVDKKQYDEEEKQDLCPDVNFSKEIMNQR
ncbi:LINE-1 retrotransposable element ORF2 protein [Dictyocoela muelleri]|nr:LINE-1 retrotransposable element ORF2 protein [Dictyocoela muelleri]